MDAKQKAKELVEKFKAYSMTYFQETTGTFDEASELKNAKACALIAVEEILSLTYAIHDFTGSEFIDTDYWEKVSEEIKQL